MEKELNSEEIKKEKKRVLENMIRELDIYDCGEYFFNKGYWDDYKELVKSYGYSAPWKELEALKVGLDCLNKKETANIGQLLVYYVCLELARKEGIEIGEWELKTENWK